MVSKGSLLALLVFLGLGVPRTLVLETRIWPIRVIVAEQVCNKSQDKHFPLYLYEASCQSWCRSDYVLAEAT